MLCLLEFLLGILTLDLFLVEFHLLHSEFILQLGQFIVHLFILPFLLEYDHILFLFGES